MRKSKRKTQSEEVDEDGEEKEEEGEDGSLIESSYNSSDDLPLMRFCLMTLC